MHLLDALEMSLGWTHSRGTGITLHAYVHQACSRHGRGAMSLSIVSDSAECLAAHWAPRLVSHILQHGIMAIALSSNEACGVTR